MTSRLAADCIRQVGHIQLVAAECSEGIILVNIGQSIIWANQAALSMHQVSEVDELGQTIDDYHARFQVKYVAVLADTAGGDRDQGGEERGRLQPEVLMEFKPQAETARSSLHRTRKMVLLDGAGRPTCIVFIIRRLSTPSDTAAKFSDLLSIFQNPAMILRHDDRGLVAANAAFLELSEQTVAPGQVIGPARGRWEAVIDVDGQKYVLVNVGGNEGPTLPAQPPEQNREVAPEVALLHAVPMHALDEDLCVVEVNQPWLDWLGYTRDAVIGRKLLDFMTPASAERFERNSQNQLASSGKVRDVPADFVTKFGSVLNALVSATPMPFTTGCTLLVSMCFDVTGQRRSEDATAAMFGHSPVPMLIRKYDDSRIIDANEAFLKATGYGQSDIVGHSFDEFGLFENKKRKDEFDACLRADGRTQPADINIKTAHGDTLDCVVTAAKIWIFGNMCVLLVLQDVSERRRTEAELLSALDAVMKDSSWFSRSVVERLAALRAPSKPGRRVAALGDLTPREKDVLSLISLGLPDAEIAERLGLTRSTIRNHLSTLYSKINVRNRGSAIIWARERCINITQLPLRVKSVQSKFGVGGPAPQQVVPLNQGGRMLQKAKSAVRE